MRYIKCQPALWHIALIVGTLLISMPEAARAWGPAKDPIVERHVCFGQAASITDGNSTSYGRDVKGKQLGTSAGGFRIVIDRGLAQDDYYARRRQYWEKRLDTRLDEEDLDGD